MHRSTSAHATHDELLLARLYGGDVDERERGRANDQIAACERCAAFFVDLGAIAAATASLPAPARPRDFTLTEADAARLKRRSSGGSLLAWIGRTRMVGSSMAAIGMAGIVVLGAISAFGPVATGGANGVPNPAHEPVFAAASAAPTAGPAGPEIAASDQGGGGRSSQDVPQPTAAFSAVVSPAATAIDQASPAPPAFTPAPSAAGSSGTGSLAVASPKAAASSEIAYDGNGKAAGSPDVTAAPVSSESGSSAPGGPDAHTLALVTFAGLLVAGLLLLGVPRIAARR